MKHFVKKLRTFLAPQTMCLGPQECMQLFNKMVHSEAVAYPGILFGWGGSTNSDEDRGQRERGSGDGSPLVWGSGGSCNLVQEISFHIVKFS